MPTRFLFICFLFVVLGESYEAYAQQEVTSLEFEGLKKTSASHLKRFLSNQSNQTLQLDKLEEDLQQIRNLPSIHNATFQLDTLPDGIHLTFQVEEALTLFPIINFGGVRDNVWVQLGATEQNVLGRGIQATAFYQNNDNRHSGQFHVRIPYFKGSRWGGSFGMVRWASVEPLFFGDETVYYQYDNHAVSLTGLRELKRNHWLEAGFSYFVESYRKDGRHGEVNTPGPSDASLPKLLLKFTHQLDRRNYHFYTLTGWDLVQHFQTVYNLDYPDEDAFRIFWSDFRYFWASKHKKGNLATRIRVGISDNRDSPFAPFVLDSHVNIRGSGNRIDRGTASLVWNLEYRHSIFDRYGFAAQAVAFSDLGNWRKPGGSLDEIVKGKFAEHFVGLGVRFIYKKMHNAILRADYGVNTQDSHNSGLVLGIGQYF